jgi:hypothetical protein
MTTTHLIKRRFRRGRYHQWAYDSTFCGDYSLDPSLTQHLSEVTCDKCRLHYETVKPFQAVGYVLP